MESKGVDGREKRGNALGAKIPGETKPKKTGLYPA